MKESSELTRESDQISISSFNLCSFYILPLLRLNYESYGTDPDAEIARSNFINAKVNLNKRGVYVYVRDEGVASQYEYWLHPCFKDAGKLPNGWYLIVYSLPDHYLTALKLFAEGKYSQFPDNIKKTIKAYSGLPHSDEFSHKYLMALDRHPLLKSYIENELDVCLSDDAELLSKPSPTNFLD